MLLSRHKLKMKYDVVLFDMDGTVLDTLQDLTDAVNFTMGHFGFEEISPRRCASILGNGAKYLISHAAPEANPEELLEFYTPYYQSHCLVKTAPYPGIIELMERLKGKGIKMAVISNKQDGATKELAERFFPSLLDFAVGESPTIKRKPDPAAVLAAIEHFGAEKERCVYVGDTEVDIQTAANAGIDCIAVSWGFRSREEQRAVGASVFADNPEEIYNLVT